MENQWEVYSLSDPRTGEVRYVGVTTRRQKRLRDHVSSARCGGRTHRDNWIRYLLAIGVTPSMQTLETGTGATWEEAERRWIATYRDTHRLINATDGGDGFSGYIPTPELKEKWSKMRSGVPYPPGRRSGMLGKTHTVETRRKIAEHLTGRPCSPETRAKISAAHVGKVLSPEHCAKIGDMHRGKHHTPEHKAKIAAATTGRKPVLCVETGEAFPSITAAARHLAVTETSVHQAMRKGCRCRGYHWRRL
jgi:group I intron endonuclease